MENNAFIGATLTELLNFLDARAIVNLFHEDGKTLLKAGVRVYELLADKDFLEAHRNTEVKGLVTIINYLNILIEEA